MKKRYDLARRECAVWAVILGGHALLLALLVYDDARQRALLQASAKSRSVLLLLPAPQPRAAPMSGSEARPATSPVSPTTINPGRPPQLALAPQPSPSEQAPAAVDWTAAADAAARSMIEQQQAAARPFRAPPGASSFRKCRKDRPPPRWNPQPRRAGFAGLLPYVRVGKRCIVGLGFFGCAIGELPKPDGELFVPMRDPEQPESSVPDADDCVP